MSVNRVFKYQEIYKDISKKIKDGVIKSGEKLPSEKEIMKLYDASRDTVRKVMNLLENNGYIQKAKGKESIVIEKAKVNFSVSELTSFKELSKLNGENIETDVIIFLKEPVDEENGTVMKLQNTDVFHVERIRSYDNRRVILDIDYLNADIVPNLTLKHARNSLYEYIEKDLNLKIAYAQKEITIQKATDREKRLLDLGEFDCLVCVKSLVYLQDTRLFQYTVSKHVPDKFRFIDFARRNVI